MDEEIDKDRQLLQLRDDLRRAKEERSQALQQLQEFKSRRSSSRDGRIDSLQAEAERAKESERRMLESLACQTKQLEQTKIMLEECRLENRSLRDSITILESPIAKGLKKNAAAAAAATAAAATDAASGHDDSGKLRNELKLALEAEEKSKKAMDDFAIALKEVTTESSCSKEKLSRAQSELETAREEIERLRGTLKHTESKLRVASDHWRRLKVDAEESSCAWSEKEKSFVQCISMLEDEISNIKNENLRTIESKKRYKEEICKLRDILKQAVSEATVVKEALEIARRENTQLQSSMSEKEDELQEMKQELECLQESEAAALETVKELQSLLVAASPMEVGLASNSKKESSRIPPPAPTVRKTISKFPSENWKDRDPCSPQSALGRALNDSQRFGSIFDMIESPTDQEEAAARAAKMAIMKKGKTKSFDGFVCFANQNPMDGSVTELGFDSPARRKRRPVLRKFGELLLRKNHK